MINIEVSTMIAIAHISNTPAAWYSLIEAMPLTLGQVVQCCEVP